MANEEQERRIKEHIDHLQHQKKERRKSIDLAKQLMDEEQNRRNLEHASHEAKHKMSVSKIPNALNC